VSGGTGEQIAFWLCGTLAVIGGLGMVLSRKAVHSALFIAMTMVNLAILYIVQGAVFLGMVQVIVYTGAVMMLFLFVLMVVGVDSSDSLVETIRGQRVAAVLAALAFGILLVAAVARATLPDVGLDGANSQFGGNLQGIAALVFGKYLLAFEVTAALLITAAIGAMILAHRERYEPRPTQAELSRRRIEGAYPGALPPPGVYARHNAVDVPALLPDGTLAEISVPESLRARGGMRPLDLGAVHEIDERAAGHEAVEGAGASDEVEGAGVGAGEELR
jgi:NADH-quinone oxidoreductase subunit J